MSEPVGRRRWAIAEVYIPGWSNGPEPQFTSHEKTACLLNASDEKAHVEITVYFEDRKPAGPYRITVPPRRTLHVRFNELEEPENIPSDTDYASVGGLRPRYAYTMGLIMLHARIAQHVPRLANLVTRTPVLKDLAKKAGGITTEREMPPFAHQTFKAWFRKREPVNPDAPPVVLFPDTFNNFLHPETAKAAVEVLEHAGYRVIVPHEALWCGRPLFDYGMLDTAKVFMNRLVGGLAPYARDGIKVVGIEPSCSAAFRDELPNLMPHDEDAKRLSKNTLTLAGFLEAEGYEPPRLEQEAVVHGHCH